MTVSRETPAPRRRRLAAPALVALAALALLAAACGRAPGPRGWAAAQPLTVDSQDLVLVGHKGTLHALGRTTGAPVWQFPPKSKDTYPVSELARENLTAGLDIPAAALADLRPKIDALKVEGSSKAVLKDAVKAATLDSKVRVELNRRIDKATTDEKLALTRVQAFYGELGVSADQRTVFVPSYKGIVFALDAATGNMRWWFNARAKLVGGVLVDGDELYFGSKGHRLFALDAASGRQLWDARVGGEVWATPASADSSIFVTTLDGGVYRFDRDGSERWAFAGASSGIAGGASVAGGLVYAGAFDNKLYALDEEDGAVRWQFEASNWFWTTPLVSYGVLYAPSLDGKVYAVDAASGAQRWAFDAGAPVRSTPVLAGGGLVVAARDGTLFKLDPATGALLDGGETETNATILADLAASGDGTVYAVPTTADLLEVSVAGALAVGGVPLP